MTVSSTTLGSLACCALLASTGAGFLPAPVRAETLVRAQGRCKLVSGGYEAFNGHCTFKHKRADSGTDSYVLQLDDGTEFMFRGPNPQSLSVQTYRGIVDVKHSAEADHEVFIWNDGEKRRLSVRLDQVQNPNANFDSDNNSATAAAIVGGAAAAALIGAIIGGNNQSTASEPARVGAPVGELQGLVGAKGAGGERSLVAKGYTYRGGTTGATSKFTFWQQPRTGNCVGVELAQGRYREIVYTKKNNCN
ncbi:MAG: hypothetical protein AAFX65_12525 [Cyanobacteria bacterium J06638_7]